MSDKTGGVFWSKFDIHKLILTERLQLHSYPNCYFWMACDLRLFKVTNNNSSHAVFNMSVCQQAVKFKESVFLLSDSQS